MKVYPRGSVEFHETPLLNAGEPFAPTKVAATPWLDPTPAPSSELWADPIELEDKFGLMVGSYPAGYYKTWTQTVDNPESPIVESEPFTVT